MVVHGRALELVRPRRQERVPERSLRLFQWLRQAYDPLLEFPSRNPENI